MKWSRQPALGLPRAISSVSALLIAIGVTLTGALGTIAAAEDNADQNLYVDYVAGSWDDWSFNANRTWNATEHVRSYDHSGKISFTQAYGAVRLHFRGFDTRAFETTGFTDLQLAIHWGDQAPMDMLVYALRNEDFNKTTKLSMSKYSVPDDEALEDGWFLVTIPLAQLGVANVTNLTDIVLSGPKAKVPFWIDDVKLIKGRGPTRIALNVDASKSLRPLDGPTSASTRPPGTISSRTR